MTYRLSHERPTQTSTRNRLPPDRIVTPPSLTTSMFDFVAYLSEHLKRTKWIHPKLGLRSKKNVNKKSRNLFFKRRGCVVQNERNVFYHIQHALRFENTFLGFSCNIFFDHCPTLGESSYTRALQPTWYPSEARLEAGCRRVWRSCCSRQRGWTHQRTGTILGGSTDCVAFSRSLSVDWSLWSTFHCFNFVLRWNFDPICMEIPCPWWPCYVFPMNPPGMPFATKLATLRTRSPRFPLSVSAHRFEWVRQAALRFREALSVDRCFNFVLRCSLYPLEIPCPGWPYHAFPMDREN